MGGVKEPVPEDVIPPKRKYLARIRTIIGWSEFQMLLNALASVALRYKASISQIALSWTLHHVSGIILGGPQPRHIASAVDSLALPLSIEDILFLEECCPAARKGSVYDVERDVSHPIGSCLAPFRSIGLAAKHQAEAEQRLVEEPFNPYLLEERRVLDLQGVSPLHSTDQPASRKWLRVPAGEECTSPWAVAAAALHAVGRDGNVAATAEEAGQELSSAVLKKRPLETGS